MPVKILALFLVVFSQHRKIFLSAILLIIHLGIYYKNPGRISNYIDIKMDGSFKIKDPLYRKEYEELTLSQEDKIFKCPRCNTQLEPGTEFCNVCGINLRGFNIK